jgi:hypothetical protein
MLSFISTIIIIIVLSIVLLLSLFSLRCARVNPVGAAREPLTGSGASAEYAYLGMAQVGQGHIGLYGDSNCLDSSHQRTACYTMLLKMLAYATEVRAFPPCLCINGGRVTTCVNWRKGMTER